MDKLKAISHVKRSFFALAGMVFCLLLLWASYKGELNGTWIYRVPAFKTGGKQQATPEKGFSAQDQNDRKMQLTKYHLDKACKILRQKQIIPFVNQSFAFPYMSVSEKFKLMGCKVTKVGSTNMGRLLYTLDHLSETNDTNKVRMGRARSWNVKGTEIESREEMKKYTKFMFVREPFERLVSAYRDKRPRSWFRKTNLTFTEFLEKIIRTPTKKLNSHHKLISSICKPCHVQYDFIGQLSRYDEDMKVILESVGASGLVVFPEREKTGYKDEKSSDTVLDFKQRITENILKQIYEKYYLDYFLFWFPIPFET